MGWSAESPTGLEKRESKKKASQSPREQRIERKEKFETSKAPAPPAVYLHLPFCFPLSFLLIRLPLLHFARKSTYSSFFCRFLPLFYFPHLYLLFLRPKCVSGSPLLYFLPHYSVSPGWRQNGWSGEIEKLVFFLYCHHSQFRGFYWLCHCNQGAQRNISSTECKPEAALQIEQPQSPKYKSLKHGPHSSDYYVKLIFSIFTVLKKIKGVHSNGGAFH